MFSKTSHRASFDCFSWAVLLLHILGGKLDLVFESEHETMAIVQIKLFSPKRREFQTLEQLTELKWDRNWSISN